MAPDRHRLAVALAVLTAALAFVASPASAERGFDVRFSENVTGNFAAASNVLLTCPASDTACGPAQRGLIPPGQTATSEKLNNNGYGMVRLDTDADPATTSSSSATLELPAGAQVLFAGLYYSGVGTAATSNRDRILIKPPGATTYGTLQAATLDDSPYNTLYQGIVDVTDLVAVAGGGVYAVANIATATGRNRHAGWALVVAYRDASEPLRNLTIEDGLRTIEQGEPPLSSPVTGFITPRSGPVRTTVGAIAYDGDAGALGDSAELNETVLSNSANPPTNFFNSAITGLDGRPLSPRTPSYVNNLGFDAVLIGADGVLRNGATDATLRVQTSRESYAVGALFFATELFAPGIQPLKSVTDLNGPPAVPGDVLEYRVAVRNTGTDAASDVTVDDPVPADTAFVPGSLAVEGGPNAGALSDASDADRGELVAARPAATVRLGELAPGATSAAVFRARVRSPLESGVEIRNQAEVRFASGTLGTPDVVPTNPTLTPVQTPNLRITKATAPLARGTVIPITLTARNDGQVPTVGEVTVVDELVPTLVPQTAPTAPSGPGWACSVAGQRVECRRSDPLPPGLAYPPITIPVFVDPALPVQVINDATVAGGGDGDVADNTVRVVADIAPVPTTLLTAQKVALDESPLPGGQARFRITVYNTRVVPATGVAVGDALPAGLELISATASQGTCAGAVTCTLGTLAGRTSATIDVVTRVTPQGAGARLVNAATATSANAPPAQAEAPVQVQPLADLSVAKTSSDSSPNAGAPVEFAITVRNGGPTAASGVTLVDLLPDGFAAAGAELDGAPGACRLDPGSVSCVVGSLAVGAQARVVVRGAFDRAGRGEAVVNHAQVAGDGVDPDPLDDRADTELVVGPAADLDLSKVGPASPVRAGETAAFTLFLRNYGPDPARDVEIVDLLPVGLRYVSSSRPCDTSRAGARDRVTCAIGTLAPGRVLEIALRAEAAASLTNQTVQNGAVVESPTPDPVDSNNRGAAPLEVGTGADVAIDKIAPGGTRPLGGDVPYILAVSNRGPTDARAVRVEDVSPPGLGLADATPSQGRCDVRGDGLECALGTIPAGGSAQVAVLARADPLAGAGPVTNLASVTSTTPDADDADNRDAAEVTLRTTPPAAPPVGLQVTTTASPPAGAGRPATFRVRVHNTGGAPAPKVALVSTAGGSPGAGVVVVRPSQGSCRPGRVTRCALGTIPPGGTATVTLRVQYRRGGAVRAVATVVAGAPLASAGDASARAAARVAQAPPVRRRAVPVTG